METTKRSCGECTACCFAPAVPSIEKPPNAWCRHCVQGEGCSIYADRPGACAEYQCGWLRNGGEVDHLYLRPDKCGFIFEFHEIQYRPEYVAKAMLMYEVREGAFEEEYARSWMKLSIDYGEYVWLMGLSGVGRTIVPKYVLMHRGVAQHTPGNTAFIFVDKKK